MAVTISGDTGISAVQTGAVESGDLPSEAYQKNNILGTVSESSGVPTGAIIERGSNANGEFVKYADGTMICFLSSFTLSADNNEGTGSTRTYPATFSANPMVFGQSLGGDFSNWSSRFVFGVQTRSTTTCVVGIWNTIGATETMNIQVMVIGRWY